MSPEPDRGDILAQESFPVEPEDTVKSLERKARAAGIRLIGPLLEAIATETMAPVPQKEADASYYPKLTAEEKLQLAALGKRN
jgi:methionyl-tRNA formyltransferase